MDSVSKQLMMGGQKEAPPGQVAYTTPGTYSWEVPSGVTSISVVCVDVEWHAALHQRGRIG